MRYLKLIAALSSLTIPAAVSAAECHPAFVDGDQAIVIDGVEIEPGGRSVQDFSVRIRNTAGAPGGSMNQAGAGIRGSEGGGPCEAAIRIARLDTTLDAEFPPYLLRGPGNQQIDILPDPASGGTMESDVKVANAPQGPRGRSVPFQIAVPTEWGLRAGTYLEQLELLLFDRNGEIVDRSTLTLTVIIPSAVTLRLVGAVVGGGGSGPAQVDLGNLSSSRETQSQPFGARI